MLDVHPPHEAAHTWRDFFIHIATIVVGLLIAIGLEQTVEHFHRRHQVAETREALRVEHEQGRLLLNTSVVMIRRERASLNNNLIVLEYIRQHPGAPQTALPGILTWHHDMDDLSTAAWATASHSTVLVSFPEGEVRTEGDFYRRIDLINKDNDAYFVHLTDAARYSFHDSDPTRITPAELDQTIALTLQCMEALHLLTVDILNLKDNFPEYAEGLTTGEVDAFSHIRTAESDPALARPIAQTIERIDAAGKLKDYFPQTDPEKK